LFPLGLALPIAAFFFQGGTALNTGQIPPTPTLDRLAKPTLPSQPSQADQGAQTYWLYCLPCHGDKGQGLTDEFRTTYPPEEQYCWERGCHGEQPYQYGFKIPKTIPAVIGDQALSKFTDGVQLNSYIRAAMPFWKPGSLTEEQTWQVTAFLLRENGIWNGVGDLNETKAGAVKILRGAPTPISIPQQDKVQNRFERNYWIYSFGILLFLFVLGLIVGRSRKTSNND
jgi:mono/diheme cytochrome c family protein